jgi:hypothetical protein
VPLWTPKSYSRVVSNIATTGSDTPGTSVTTGAAAATKGAAAQLLSAAANTIDSWGITIIASNVAANAAASECALDILTGAATEDILIPDLLAGYAGDVLGAKQWFFPLYIPAGTRIAARAASVRTAAAIRVLAILHGGSPPPFRCGRRVTTYGMGTVPNGTAVTPTASGGAASTTEITAATTEDHFAFLPSFQLATDTTVQASSLAIGIGLGANTVERLATWIFWKNAAEMMSGPFPVMPAFRDVPAGTRLSLLASNGGVNDDAYNGVIHAVS